MSNFHHVEQLFDYGSTIRKIMYTTNAVERTHSSFKRVTKKRTFPNENAFCVLKNWKQNGMAVSRTGLWSGANYSFTMS